MSTDSGAGGILQTTVWARAFTEIAGTIREHRSSTAASRALCALEILANADELAGDYIVTPIEVPDDLSATTLSLETLPPNWDG